MSKALKERAEQAEQAKIGAHVHAALGFLRHPYVTQLKQLIGFAEAISQMEPVVTIKLDLQKAREARDAERVAWEREVAEMQSQRDALTQEIDQLKADVEDWRRKKAEFEELAKQLKARYFDE